MKQTKKKVKRFFAAGKTSVKSTIFPFFCPHRLCCLNPALQRSTRNKARPHPASPPGTIRHARGKFCRQNACRPAEKTSAGLQNNPLHTAVRSAEPYRRAEPPHLGAAVHGRITPHGIYFCRSFSLAVSASFLPASAASASFSFSSSERLFTISNSRSSENSSVSGASFPYASLS